MEIFMELQDLGRTSTSQWRKCRELKEEIWKSVDDCVNGENIVRKCLGKGFPFSKI
jgi:hypothetical protein